MDKYGVVPKKARCPACGGNGCAACNQTGRKSGKVEPKKEAQMLREQQAREVTDEES